MTGKGRPSGRPPARAEARAEPERPPVPRLLGWLSGPAIDTSWPPIWRSLGRGFLAVGSSPLILLPSFGLLFLLWVALVALGLEGPPGRLVNLLALPPVSTYFDALNGVSIYGFGLTGFLAAIGFLLARAVVLALLTALIVRVFEGEGGIGETLLRGLRIAPVTAVVGLLSLSTMILGSVVLPFLGPGLGFLGSILLLVGAMFLLVFAPVLALRRPDLPLPEVIRRGARAALMPGSRHLLMSLLYVFIALPLLLALTPGGSDLGVNPSLATWVWALLCTFVHLGFLAAFAYRLMSVEEEIPDRPARARRR
ncbi:MAG: hypothetical protein KatS3mg014_1800 [Actinomycetota bacterium]|nr:MAG: hypothetical protein KatS3mg014_1800 [Actinomycetota bacterium]